MVPPLTELALALCLGPGSRTGIREAGGITFAMEEGIGGSWGCMFDLNHGKLFSPRPGGEKSGIRVQAGWSL